MSEEQARYITDAMEMIGITQPRQIVQEVSGFVPVFEAILDFYGDHITALVFGRRWQYCRMKDGICTASLERIANDLKLSGATVMRHTEKLVAGGHLIDLTPNQRNAPHEYADAGLVIMKSQLSAGIAQRNATVSERNATVSESQLIKDSIRQDRQSDTTIASIFKLYETEIGILTPMIADELTDAEKVYPAEWLKDAMGEAVANNKRNWKYILAILKRWKAQGYKSDNRQNEKPAEKLVIATGTDGVPETY